MRVKVTHSKQLARQKPLHQTIPVIRSIKSVQLMYWFFYFTEFFDKQGAVKNSPFDCCVVNYSVPNNDVPFQEAYP